MADSRSAAADHYRQYGPAVYRRCLRLLGDPEAAKDATQEVFMKLVRDMEELAGRETVLPWIYRVATNHCLNVRRDTRRRGEETALPDLEVSAAAPEAGAYPARALAQRVLSRFDEATRTVAVGVLVDGMEHEEVAEALGVSRRTVARKLERFLSVSRRMLQGEDA